MLPLPVLSVQVAVSEPREPSSGAAQITLPGRVLIAGRRQRKPFLPVWLQWAPGCSSQLLLLVCCGNKWPLRLDAYNYRGGLPVPTSSASGPQLGSVTPSAEAVRRCNPPCREGSCDFEQDLEGAQSPSLSTPPPRTQTAQEPGRGSSLLGSPGSSPICVPLSCPPHPRTDCSLSQRAEQALGHVNTWRLALEEQPAHQFEKGPNHGFQITNLGMPSPSKTAPHSNAIRWVGLSPCSQSTLSICPALSGSRALSLPGSTRQRESSSVPKGWAGSRHSERG